jgi:hypothetical protein
MTNDDVILTNIFEDTRWRQIDRRLYFAEIDDQKLGGVLATWNGRYDNFALNRDEMERLIAALHAGKIGTALVIAVEKNGTGRYEFRRAVNAEELHARLHNKPTITGTYGSFWTLQSFEFELEEKPF